MNSPQSPAPSPQLDVLYEDNHLLAVNKPAMLPTMGVAGDRTSLLDVAKAYIRHKYHKPGNVYLGIVSRLDAPVTGVVLMARTSKAAGRLSEQFRERDVEKIYWALVEGRIEPSAGRLVDYLRKDERHRRMHVTSPNTPGGQRAELAYNVFEEEWESGRGGEEEKRLARESPPLPLSLSPRRVDVSLVEVQLLTGRKHQIRVQLAHAGFPVVGDRKYGSKRAFPAGIALHSRRLSVLHPVSKMQIEIEAPLPGSWRKFVAAS
jgi:23S rRNA pseudouridine1911/1915/1917 synthase